MQNELKPCPFCGATPYIICNKYRHNEFSWSVKCSNNDCHIIPMTYEHMEERYAINDWNKRFEDVAEVKHGEWHALKNCSNEGVYCSVCSKKVYKIDYANQKIKSPYCPNCGAKMDLKKRRCRIMTPQEAINFINNEVQIDVRFCTDEDIEKTQEAFNLAISTLEKQIPKKPIAIRETLLGKIFSDRIISFTCPNCNHKDLGNNEFRFPCCEECGQALDWSVYDG